MCYNSVLIYLIRLTKLLHKTRVDININGLSFKLHQIRNKIKQ